MQSDVKAPSGTGDGLEPVAREASILAPLLAADLDPAHFSWWELSPGQRAMIATLEFERRVADGGLQSYFFSSNGALDDAVREGLELIGAFVALGFFERATQTFPGGELPHDTDDRLEIMGLTTADMLDDLAALERQFKDTGETGENLTLKRLAYIDGHPREFFR